MWFDVLVIPKILINEEFIIIKKECLKFWRKKRRRRR